MRRAWGAVLLVAVALGACSTGDDDEASMAVSEDVATSDAGGGEEAEGQMAFDDADEAARASGAAGGGQPAPAAAPPVDVESKVVRTASIEVEVAGDDFQAAVREATRLATALGGFVSASDSSSFEDGEGRADLELRVPVARFDQALEQLAALGELESESIEGRDVTGELVDLGARLKTLRAEEEALNAILAEARNVGDLLAVRGQITGIRSQIEQLAAQQASLEDRAAFSTIAVGLHEPSAAPATKGEEPDSWTLADAWAQAVDVAEGVVGAGIVAIGFATPLLLVGLPLWFLWRRYGRRHAAQPG